MKSKTCKKMRQLKVQTAIRLHAATAVSHTRLKNCLNLVTAPAPRK
jgi:hypothetical protein